MALPDISRSDPARLSKMLEFEVAGCPWQPDELHAILAHQLDAPIDLELGSPPSPDLQSFGDVLTHSSPPVDLLELIKEFAKANMLHPDSSLPREIATVLYYAAICAAIVRSDRRISALSNPSLAQGIGTTLEWEWIDPLLRDLLKDGLVCIQEPEDQA